MVLAEVAGSRGSVKRDRTMKDVKDMTLKEYAAVIPEQPFVFLVNGFCPKCGTDSRRGVLISNPPMCRGCRRTIYSNPTE